MAKPSRLALVLLDRFIPDNEAYVGDLLEEFERRQSSLWLWREVLGVLLLAAFRPPPDARPLRLVDRERSLVALERARALQMQAPRTISLAASPVYGIGGIGLLTIVVFISLVAPSVWWALLLAFIGGALIAVARIAMNRRRTSRPGTWDREILHIAPGHGQSLSGSSRRV